MLTAKKHEFMSEFARKYLAEGKAQGKAEGKAESVLAVLRARGLTVCEEERVRIDACRDIQVLDSWIARVATVRSTRELAEGIAEGKA
ncbi:MAG: hypothetical protein HY720_07555, partial [Planctomycetes bacterium]|nr:hypothetical protein [Planctomycetota bacterium]